MRPLLACVVLSIVQNEMEGKWSLFVFLLFECSEWFLGKHKLLPFVPQTEEPCINSEHIKQLIRCLGENIHSPDRKQLTNRLLKLRTSLHNDAVPLCSLQAALFSFQDAVCDCQYAVITVVGIPSTIFTLERNVNIVLLNMQSCLIDRHYRWRRCCGSSRWNLTGCLLWITCSDRLCKMPLPCFCQVFFTVLTKGINHHCIFYNFQHDSHGSVFFRAQAAAPVILWGRGGCTWNKTDRRGPKCKCRVTQGD